MITVKDIFNLSPLVKEVNKTKKLSAYTESIFLFCLSLGFVLCQVGFRR